MLKRGFTHIGALVALFVAIIVVEPYSIQRERTIENVHAESPVLALTRLEYAQTASPHHAAMNSVQSRITWIDGPNGLDQFHEADKLGQVLSARVRFAVDFRNRKSASFEARLSNFFYSHATLSAGVLRYLECKQENCLIKVYAASPIGFSNAIEDAMRDDSSGRTFSARRKPDGVGANSWAIEYYVEITALEKE